jgi:hypothetical protein
MLTSPIMQIGAQRELTFILRQTASQAQLTRAGKMEFLVVLKRQEEGQLCGSQCEEGPQGWLAAGLQLWVPLGLV